MPSAQIWSIFSTALGCSSDDEIVICCGFVVDDDSRAVLKACNERGIQREQMNIGFDNLYQNIADFTERPVVSLTWTLLSPIVFMKRGRACSVLRQE